MLVLPSAYESLSLAVLEAWSAHRPVLVNARSAVLVGQCLRSGGGRAYANAGEFAAALDALDASTSRELGARGAAYVRERYDWAGVNERLRAHLATTFDWPEEQRG